MSERAPTRREPARFFGVVGLVVTGLLVLVTVIAYRANVSLPFERAYRATVDVPNADRLIKTNDVRIAGVRVGQVQRVTVIPGAGGGAPFARLELKLQAGLRPLPADSTVEVRPAGVLGATYVALTLGSGAPAKGDHLPVAQAENVVGLTDLLDIFDRRTARAMQASLTNLGDGVAGRGTALNATWHPLAALLGPLERVTRTLAAPETRLAGFVVALDGFSRALAPADAELAGAVRGAAATFGALGGERRALGQTLDRLPGAEAGTTAALRAVRPALDDLSDFSETLRPSVQRLPTTLRTVNSTLRAGHPALRGLPPLTAPLRDTFVSVRTLSERPATERAVAKTADLFQPIGDLLDVLGPAQTECNAVSLWGEGWSRVFGILGSGKGPGLANLVITSTGAPAEGLQNATPSQGVNINYLPHENEQECESNNTLVTEQSQLGNPEGLQPTTTRPTEWHADARSRAQAAGLLDPPVEARP